MNEKNYPTLLKLQGNGAGETPSTGQELVTAFNENAENLLNAIKDVAKDIPSVSQQTGSGQNTVMSQEATTEALNEKFDKANVLQELGSDTTKVISQKGVRDAINKTRTEINVSVEAPEGGVKADGSPGGDLYTHATAIAVLPTVLSKLGTGNLVIGTTLTAKDNDNSGNPISWIYLGGVISMTSNWRLIGVKKIDEQDRLTEIDNFTSVNITDDASSGYINVNTNNIVESDDYNIKVIQLSAGQILAIKVMTGNAIGVIALTDATQSYYKSVVSGINNIYNYSYQALEDCYIAISYKVSSAYKYAYIGRDSKIKALYDELATRDNIVNSSMSVDYSMKEGYLIDTNDNGNLIVSANYSSIENLVSLKDNILKVLGAELHMIAYYNANKEYVVSYQTARQVDINLYSYCKLCFKNSDNPDGYDNLRIIATYTSGCYKVDKEIESINTTLDSKANLSILGQLTKDSSGVVTGKCLAAATGALVTDTNYSATENYINVSSGLLLIKNAVVKRYAYYDADKVFKKMAYAFSQTDVDTYALCRLAFLDSDNPNGYDDIIINNNQIGGDVELLKGKTDETNVRLNSLEIDMLDKVDVSMLGDAKLNDFTFLTGYNLASSNGMPVADAAYSMLKDYIDISSNILKIIGATFYRIAYYDENFIYQKVVTTLLQSDINTYPICRVSFKNSNNADGYNNLQLITDSLNPKVVNIEKDIVRLNRGIEYPISFLKGVLIGSAGEFMSSPNFASTENYIDIRDGYLQMSGATLYRVYYYDENFIYQKVVATIEVEHLKLYAYCKLSFYNADNPGGYDNLKVYATYQDNRAVVINPSEKAIQINDGLSQTAANAVNLAYDHTAGLVAASYQASWLGYGETKEKILLTLYPLTQPHNCRHIEICKIGDVIADVANTGSIEQNVIPIGDRKFRVFFVHNYSWWYKDYNFDTDTLSSATKVVFKDGDTTYPHTTWINKKDYLETKGYEYDITVDSSIFTSSLYKDSNDRWWGCWTGIDTNPVVIYSDDNLATWQAFCVYPKTATYEASVVWVDTRMHVLARGQADMSSDFSAGYSDDNGVTWTFVDDAFTLDNNRPRLYNMGGQLLYAHGDKSWRYGNRKRIVIKLGSTYETARTLYILESEWGICYFSLLIRNNELYIAYSDSQAFMDSNKGDSSSRQGKDVIKFAHVGKI